MADTHTDAAPEFGQADLSNCEREQIHLAGSIQPHGALLVVDEPDQAIIQASDNAAEFLDFDGELIGSRLLDLPGNLAQRLRPHLSDPLDAIPRAVRCRIGDPGTLYDGLVHRPGHGGLIIELERAGPSADLSRDVDSALQRIRAAATLHALCDETAQLFKEIAGYDRVMVYRFDEDGHGEVFAERRESDMESYLGNRYPASDIPQIARRLYEQNRIRVLVDVAYQPVAVSPRLSPLTGRDLDMSLCFLRSMSPIHIQYLKNMGVGATLVVSLMVGGRLWGLVACHHRTPRVLAYELRTVCELLGESIATRIMALESFVRVQAELSVRRLEQRMIDAIAREGDWRHGLFDGSQSLLQPINARGAALLFEGQIMTAGEVPGTRHLRAIRAWLDARPREPVFATDSFGLDEPQFEELIPTGSGLVAVPVSTSPGDYLLWFRPEQIHTVTWGGDPSKPMVIGDDPSDLSPRRSFAQWHECVRGTSAPWTDADRAAARVIGESVADVVLQSRSVRMLIAQDQLAQISQQVRVSDQPVVILDAQGRILLTSEKFARMLDGVRTVPRRMVDLAPYFAEPDAFRARLDDLLQHWRPWRGEVGLALERGTVHPLALRADPVLAAPDRLLGFVLLFTDLTQQRAAEAARRRFQEGIIERHWVAALNMDSQADLLYRELLASVVENARLAALEITDGVDPAEMPEVLQSVQSATTRSAELLAHLVWHATRASERD